MRFNHMELTLPKGELTVEAMADLSAFYGDVLGWSAREVEVVGKNLYLDVGHEQFIVHAFYVKYILPIFFDVQVIERADAG